MSMFLGKSAEKGLLVNHKSLRFKEEPERSRHSALKNMLVGWPNYVSGLRKGKKNSLITSQTSKGGKQHICVPHLGFSPMAAWLNTAEPEQEHGVDLKPDVMAAVIITPSDRL